MQQGQVMGQLYQIIEEIGHGGTGVIYKAYHLRLGKYVVIKKIKDHFTGAVNVRTEADILKKLRHTCLPQVYDFIQEGSQVFTVMDYIDGYDLEYYLERGIYFQPQQLLVWLRELCGVLVYLHSQHPPILHSDIKPANLMLTSEGNICLIDFNISFGLEEEKDILGISPYYAAPEQSCRARLYGERGLEMPPLDGRMDLYSLAATFYRLVSGIRPSIDYETNIPLSDMHLPEFAPGFLHVIDKSMRINPQERYHTAKEMYEALSDLRRMDTRYRRLRLGVIAATAAYAAGLILSAGLILYGRNLCIREDFMTDYGIISDALSGGNEELALDKCFEILNKNKYKGLLEQQNERKAEILHVVGNYYDRKGDYANASVYYGDAAEISNLSAEAGMYSRDYAISLAKEGKVAQAESILQQLEQSGVNSVQIHYIEAEIAYAKQEYEKAEEKVQMVLDGNPDTELKIKSYMLKADISGKLGKEQEQAACLEKAWACGGQAIVLRKLGVAYMGLAKNAQKGMEKSKYYKKALEIYRQLSSLAYPSVEDRLNLAIVYLQMGENYHCEEMLLAMTEEGVWDYRVWMYLAFSYEGEGDWARMRPCCKQAVEIYEASIPSRQEREMDGQIRHLYELYERIGG